VLGVERDEADGGAPRGTYVRSSSKLIQHAAGSNGVRGEKTMSSLWGSSSREKKEAFLLYPEINRNRPFSLIQWIV
jgi:hypothetical protein